MAAPEGGRRAAPPSAGSPPPGLTEELFRDRRQRLYAILDGASIPGLLGKLDRLRPAHACLFAGKLDPSVEQTAPYVVELVRGSEMTRWLLAEGFGKHWGIFALSQVDLGTLRKHLKTFLLVRDPDGKRLYFRYYDPRVMRVYLPSCNADEARQVFGPVLTYLMEDDTGTNLVVFERGTGSPAQRKVPIGT